MEFDTLCINMSMSIPRTSFVAHHTMAKTTVTGGGSDLDTGDYSNPRFDTFEQNDSFKRLAASFEEMLEQNMTVVEAEEPARTPKTIAERRRQLHAELMETTKTSPMKKVRRSTEVAKRRAKSGIAAAHSASLSVTNSKRNALAINVLLTAYNNVLPAVTDMVKREQLDRLIIGEVNRRVTAMHEPLTQMREGFVTLSRSYQTLLVRFEELQTSMHRAEQQIIGRTIDIAHKPQSVLDRDVMIFSRHQTGNAPFRGVSRTKEKSYR